MSEKMELFNRLLKIGQVFEELAISQIIKYYNKKYLILPKSPNKYLNMYPFGI